MKIIAKLIGISALTSLLSACGGGGGASFTGGTGTGNTGGTGGSSAGAAHTIAISYPISNSIENLNGGFYRRIGKATVTDRDGQALPDGTQIRLEVIDSIIATGTIGDDPGDAVSGTSLSDDTPMLADLTSIDFTSAAVTRTTGSGDTRFIEAGDEVLFFNLASGADKRRFVATAPSATNSLTVTSAYSGSYPSATYPDSDYIVGAALLGASVAGVDANGNATPGVATMTGGTASFYVTYPANVNTINTGCGISAIDTRSEPLGSADVYLIARTGSGSGTVMTLDNSFCFSPIGGFAVDPFPAAATLLAGAGPLEVNITVEDGGDGVRVPFWQGLIGVELTGAATVSITQDQGGLTPVEVYPNTTNRIITNANGVATVNISLETGATGDTATITFRFSDTDAPVTITAL